MKQGKTRGKLTEAWKNAVDIQPGFDEGVDGNEQPWKTQSGDMESLSRGVGSRKGEPQVVAGQEWDSFQRVCSTREEHQTSKKRLLFRVKPQESMNSSSVFLSNRSRRSAASVGTERYVNRGGCVPSQWRSAPVQQLLIPPHKLPARQ